MGDSKKNQYLQHKLPLYFDANFSVPVINQLKQVRSLRKRCRFIVANEVGFENQSDEFHFNHCRKNGYILVTHDHDFLDDRKYPIDDRLPGIIFVKSTSNGDEPCFAMLRRCIEFIANFQLPRLFTAASKIRITEGVVTIIGKSIRTGKLVRVEIGNRTTSEEVAHRFGYPHR